MFVVLGVSGQTGGATASALLKAGRAVRVVVRDPAKGEAWRRRGAEVRVGDVHDADALAQALAGAAGAYLMHPPALAEAEPFAEAARVGRCFAQALHESGIAKAVVLSSVGGHLAAGTGIIRSNHEVEAALADSSTALTFLRAHYFMENWRSVLEPMRSQGVLPSFLPLDFALPMQTVADVGCAAAALLCQSWQGHRVVELEGPRPETPRSVADAFSARLGRPVVPVFVPSEARAAALAPTGMSPAMITALVEMYDAIADGTVTFEGAPWAKRRVAGTPLAEVVPVLLAAASDPLAA